MPNDNVRRERKALGGRTLLSVAIVAYILSAVLGTNLVGSGFGVLALIAFLMAIVAFIREARERKRAVSVQPAPASPAAKIQRGYGALGFLLATMVGVAMKTTGVKIGGVALFLSVGALVGYAFGHWYGKRTKRNRVLVGVISWSNLLTWLSPVLGALTGVAAYQLGRADGRKGHQALGIIGTVLAIANGIVAVLFIYD